MIAIRKTILFCKMSENVLIFWAYALKFTKSAKMTLKDAEFYADSKYDEKGSENVIEKSFKQKTVTKKVLSKKLSRKKF
jgi:hypothetical protein